MNPENIYECVYPMSHIIYQESSSGKNLSSIFLPIHTEYYIRHDLRTNSTSNSSFTVAYVLLAAEVFIESLPSNVRGLEDTQIHTLQCDSISLIYFFL